MTRDDERFEESAALFQEFQPAYVLRLLRTERYLRAVYPTESAVSLRRRVRQAQAILDDTARRFEMILTEGALRATVSTTDVHVEQLEHIVAAAQRPNLRLGVIPWHRRLEALIGHAFHLYDDETVMVGYATGRIVSNAAEEVARYRDAFAALRSCAAFDREAVTELRRIAMAFTAAPPGR